MIAVYKAMSIGIATALMLAGLTMSAQALVPGGGITSFGGESRGITQIKGSVVCVGCSLREVRATQPDLRRLYQLNHAQGQLVMTVKSVNEPAWWQGIVGLSRQLSVRAPTSLFQQLTAEEHLFKEVEVLGLLRSNRTLDIGDVTIPGPSTAELASAAATEAAAARAEAAAVQAEAAAVQAEAVTIQAEEAAERAGQTVQRIEAMTKKLDGGFAEL